MREFYTQKVAKCLLASQQGHTLADKKVLLRIAATYVGLVLEIDLREDCRYDTTPPAATGIADWPCSIRKLPEVARADLPPPPTTAAPVRRRTFRVIAGGRVE
jgi:hypothetical protein